MSVMVIGVDVILEKPMLFVPAPGEESMTFDEAVMEFTRTAISSSGFVFIVFETESDKKQILTTADVVLDNDMPDFDPRDYL